MPTSIQEPGGGTNVRVARTFHGRRIITITRDGRDVEVVEGLQAVKVKQPDLATQDRGFMVESADPPPALGITVRDEVVPFDRGSSVDIEWSEPLVVDRGSAAPDDPFFAQQWALEAIKAEAAWNGASVAGVVIAVLDTGVAMESGSLSHPDLPASIDLGRNVVAGTNTPVDDHGHGTHVAGLIAASTNNAVGIAGLWSGGVLVVKVLNENMDGTSVTFKDGVVAAVEYAKAAGARLVINYSAGGADALAKQEAVRYAQDEGALIVAAAGNSFASPIQFPAAYAGAFPHVMAVAAVARNNEAPLFGTRGPEMTIAAPGVGVLSTLPPYVVTMTGEGKRTSYDELDGTSQASPQVAALAAHVWARRPAWTSAEVRAHIQDTADPLEQPEVFGSGIINVTRALQAL